VNFIGAVDPNNDWTYGWTNLGAQKQLVGDTNYSDTVTVSDVIKVNRIAGALDPVQACVDANNSGGITVADVILTNRMAGALDPTRVCCQE
jgi:hypothetical protein